MGTPRHLCQLQDLPEGSARGFDTEGAGRDTIFVVHLHGVRAWRNACPHWADTPMAWRTDAYLSGDGGHIMCHAHGARFDVRSGICVHGPCVGSALTSIPIFISDEGEILLASAQ